MIELIDIVQKFPGAAKGDPEVLVLNKVSLSLTKPSITMLLGPSGCGKSTLLYMMGGVRSFNIQTPTSGIVKIFGEECEVAHNEVAMVFQKYSNRPDLTVYENCAFPFKLRLYRKTKDWKPIVEKMLKAVGLWDKRNNYTYELSGGQNQRLALARCLALKPKILLMDEPFGALDAQTREEMQDLLVSLQAQNQCMIVFVTHDISEALILGDRILVMSTRPANWVGDYQIDQSKMGRDKWLGTSEAHELRTKIMEQLRSSSKEG